MTEPAAGTTGTGPSAGDRPAIDTSEAHSARVHDYWLGGKDNYAAGRTAGPGRSAYAQLIVDGSYSADA